MTLISYIKKFSLKTKFSLIVLITMLIVSGLLSALTYSATQEILTSDGESFATKMVQTNSSLFNKVTLSTESINRLFDSIQLPKNSGLILFDQGSYYLKGNIPNQDIVQSKNRFSKVAEFSNILSIDGNYYIVAKTTFVLKPFSLTNPTSNNSNFRTGYMIELISFSAEHEALKIFVLLLIAFSLFFAFLGMLVFQFYFGKFQKRLRKVSVAASKVSKGTSLAPIELDGYDELNELSDYINSFSYLLKSKLDEEQRFAADVSHELRSPLHTLATTAGILTNHIEELKPSAREALILLNAEIERFSKLVIDLLEISRIDSQLSDSDLETVSIYRLVQESLKSLGIKVTISCKETEKDIMVQADKKRFERVIDNIANNANRYANGIKAIIISKLVDTVIIYFDDDGPGIDPELRQVVFERFHRGNSSGSRGLEQGTGLGLTLVSKIVARHKGKVFIDSSPQGGARIALELPIVLP